MIQLVLILKLELFKGGAFPGSAGQAGSFPGSQGNF